MAKANTPNRRQQHPDEDHGDMTVEEAGRIGGQIGGQVTKAEYGPEFYSKIGHEGGIEAHRQHPDLAERAGHKGGQKVKRLIEEGKENEGR